MNESQAKRIMEISKNTYEMIAADFAATRNRVWPEMERLVKKYVQPGMRVLDVGCGNGRLLEVLPEVRYIGIDGCEALVREAENKLKIQNSKLKIIFRVLDMLEIEKLGEGNFDVVFMFASFNHIAGEENRLKVLEGIKKILKPGGMLIMSNWNMWRIGTGKSVWKYKIIETLKHRNTKTQKLDLGFWDVMTRWQSGDKKRQGELYYRAFGLREIKGLLVKAGFEMMENYYSLDGKKTRWWKGKNIVSVGRLVGK